MIRPLFYCRQVINGVSNCYFRCSLDMNFYIKKCKILPQCNNKMQTEMHCDNSDFKFWSICWVSDKTHFLFLGLNADVLFLNHSSAYNMWHVSRHSGRSFYLDCHSFGWYWRFHGTGQKIFLSQGPFAPRQGQEQKSWDKLLCFGTKWISIYLIVAEKF